MTPASNPSDPFHLTDQQLADRLGPYAGCMTPHQLRAHQQEALRRLPVRPLVGGDYVVASRTTPGAWWLVAPGAGTSPATCTCPADTPRCWHVRQVERYAALDSALHARPSGGPANVSALVD